MTTLDSLRSLLEAHLCRGVEGCCSIEASGAPRPYSRIYRARCASHSYPLMVKHCLDPVSGTADVRGARAQFGGLEHAWRRAGRASRYGVPEPVLLLEEHAIVVAEWVDAPSMTKLLCDWRTTRLKALQLMSDAAHWLRWFHESSAVGRAPVACDELVGRLGEGDAYVLRDSAFRAGRALLERTGPRMRTVALAGGQLHGDYKADNLLMPGDRVIGIDLEPGNRGTQLLDAASFLNHVHLLAWHPKAWRLQRWRKDLEAAFVGGYLARAPAPDERLALAWLRLFNVLGAWLDAGSETASVLRLGFAHLCYRRVVRALCRGLSAAAAG